VSAGAELSGGPFVLELEGATPFLPEPRPVPLARNVYTGYLRVLGPVSLGYTALTALLTRSLARSFEALLLVNPRTAIIGMEAANLDAAARALRAGITVIGTRPDRSIRLPQVLLLDGPRVLTDGLEITTALPLDEALDSPQLLALAGGVSAAAGFPWGNIFPRAGNAPATNGSFNGLWAAASVQGVRYTLGPPEDPPGIDEAVEVRHRGGYLLMLSREKDSRALGLVALRPRKGPGTRQLPDGRWMLTDGLEITTVLPLDEALDAPQVMALASGVSTAAGSPWGGVFSQAAKAPAADGSFNGLWAAASVHGVRYVLGPPEDPPAIGAAVELRHQGGYLLVLCREEDWRPLGFVTVRPRLSLTCAG
jgi:hypothetical protein